MLLVAQLISIAYIVLIAVAFISEMTKGAPE